jgi:flagellar biosynthesis/type III secretory pathway chaperone
MNQPLASASPKPESTTALDIAHACLALLHDLETSLQASQQALLARDLPRLEQLTREQNALRRDLVALWTAAKTLPTKTSISEDSLALELRTSAARVLHLGRIQLALLDRAQRSLRALSRLIAGPQASYGPFAGVEEIAVRRNRDLSSNLCSGEE